MRAGGKQAAAASSRVLPCGEPAVGGGLRTLATHLAPQRAARACAPRCCRGACPPFPGGGSGISGSFGICGGGGVAHSISLCADISLRRTFPRAALLVRSFGTTGEGGGGHGGGGGGSGGGGSSAAEEEEGSSSWTPEREDRLRSALLSPPPPPTSSAAAAVADETYGKEDGRSGDGTVVDLNSDGDHNRQLDLSHEMRLLVSSLSARGDRLSDLPGWIELAERYVDRQSAASAASSSTTATAVVNYEMVPYETAIRALLAASTPHSSLHLQEADRLMDSMLTKWEGGRRPSSFSPINDLFGHVITAWARCKEEKLRPQQQQRGGGARGRGAGRATASPAAVVPGDRAESWLRRWVGIALDRRSRIEDGPAARSTSPVSEFINVPGINDDPRSGPKALVFGAAIDAHAKSRRGGAATRAENLLGWLQELGDRHGTDDGFDESTRWWSPPRPNAVMYTSVIDGWARSANYDPSAASHAERWLRTMEVEYFDRDNGRARPGVLAYLSVIMAHARSAGALQKEELRRRQRGGGGRGRGGSSRNANPAVLAENILLRLLRRNEELGRKVSSGGLHVGEEGNDGEDVAAAAADVIHPDINIFNGIIDAWARQVGMGRDDREKLDDIKYASRAEGWLALLLGRFDNSAEGGGDDRIIGSAISKIGAKSMRDNDDLRSLSPVIAESGVAPDVVTYNTVINAYCSVRYSVPAVRRAELCFKAMREQQIEPTGITFGSLIKGWGNTRSAAGAVEATRYLEEYEALGRARKLEPHVLVYNSVMNAWANSGREDKLKHMITILRRMERCWDDDCDRGAEGEDEAVVGLVPPDQVTYASYLKGISSHASLDRTKAFASLLGVLDKLTGCDDRIEPATLTFVSILACVAKCVPSPEDRSDPRYIELCRKVFERCCHHGLVSGVVLGTLRTALEPDPGARYYTDMVGGIGGHGEGKVVGISGTNDETEIIPREWRRNVRGNERAKGRTHGPTTKVATEKSRANRLSSRRHLPR